MTRLQNSWESLRSTYWFIPGLILLLSAGLSFLTQQFDGQFQGEIGHALPGIFQGGPDGARSMLATIAGSMITAAAVTFSITIAALATTSSQLGPRLLRIFMQDTGSQIVLGTFLGTFIYCVLALRLVPPNGSSDQVPHLSTSVALILALASIGVLIYFIHHMATMLQASHVTARVGAELLESIGSRFPEDLGWGPSDDDGIDAIDLSESGGDVLPDADHAEVRARSIGYVQAVDDSRLMQLAVQHDVVIRVALRPGTFVVPEGLIAVIWPAESATEELQAAMHEAIIVGGRRTPFQDVELFFDELIEIALRALSPGINDPYTAVTCIDWLTAGLASLARRRNPSRYRYDHDRALRVIADGPAVEQLIESSFDPIRNAGKEHPFVLRKLLQATATIGTLAKNPADLSALRRQALAIDHHVRQANFADHERVALLEVHREALRVLNTAS